MPYVLVALAALAMVYVVVGLIVDTWRDRQETRAMASAERIATAVAAPVPASEYDYVYGATGIAYIYWSAK